MTGVAVVSWVNTSLLFSMRIVPLLVFTPPFTLVIMPRLFRALLAVGLAATITGGLGRQDGFPTSDLATLLPAAMHELLTGLALAMPFQFLYAGLYTAGRSIDIQAGLGTALLIDPRSKGQVPMVGSIIGYVAGAIFVAQDGLHDVLRIMAASLDVVPIGMPSHGLALATLGAQLTLMCALGFGVVGGLMVTLFLTDVVIGLLARTVPQMNALILGIQVKSLALLALLPVVLAMSGSLLAHMIVLTLEAMPRLI